MTDELEWKPLGLSEAEKRMLAERLLLAEYCCRAYDIHPLPSEVLPGTQEIDWEAALQRGIGLMCGVPPDLLEPESINRTTAQHQQRGTYGKPA